jgi:hypothetical protein
VTAKQTAIEILTGFWLHLKPHAERDTIFVVTQDLDLLEVATRIAADDVDAISTWIESAQIAKPTLDQIEAWDQAAAKLFRFAIVQPYVLIQEEGH